MVYKNLYLALCQLYQFIRMKDFKEKKKNIMVFQKVFMALINGSFVQYRFS